MMRKLSFLLCAMLVPALLMAAETDLVSANPTAGVGVVEVWDLPGDGPLYHFPSGNGDPNRACFTTVDYFDATSATPTVAELLAYDSIICYSGWGWYADPVALGNNAADYADAGGGIVLTSLCNYDSINYNLAGRMFDPPYMAINRGSGNNTVALGSFDPGHPRFYR